VVRPCLAAHLAAADPSVQMAEARADPSVDRRPVRRPTAQGTPARPHLVGHDPARGHHPGSCRDDAANRGLALHRDVRGVEHDAGLDRTDRSDPDRQLQDIDRHFRGGGEWLDRGVRTRPRLAGPHPLEEPPSAPARPLAARHTGRAALPSATFPHHLPAVRQISRPFSSAPATGATKHRRSVSPENPSSCAVNWQSCNVTRSAEWRAIRLTLKETSALRLPGHCQPCGWHTHASLLRLRA
jgi:hypothetical protein